MSLLDFIGAWMCVLRSCSPQVRPRNCAVLRTKVAVTDATSPRARGWWTTPRTPQTRRHRTYVRIDVKLCKRQVLRVCSGFLDCNTYMLVVSLLLVRGFVQALLNRARCWTRTRTGTSPRRTRTPGSARPAGRGPPSSGLLLRFLVLML